MNKSIK
jgi:hypothetical protein